MTVYIEYVIVDNLVITALICIISYRVLKAKPDKLKTLIAAITGTAAAVCYPFLSWHSAWLLLIKCVLFVLLSIILFYKKTRLFRGAAVFLLVTAGFGGLIFMVAYLISGDAVAALTLPSYDFPFGIILLLPVGIYYILKRIIFGVVKKRAESNFSFKFDVSALGKTVSAVGFLDSGNLLCDEKTGLPVVVAGAKLSVRLLSDSQLTMLLTKRGAEICKGARYMKFDTLSGGEELLIVPAQKFRLYLGQQANTLKEVMLGLSFKGLKGEYDALLSPLVF